MFSWVFATCSRHYHVPSAVSALLSCNGPLCEYVQNAPSTYEDKSSLPLIMLRPLICLCPQKSGRALPEPELSDFMAGPEPSSLALSWVNRETSLSKNTAGFTQNGPSSLMTVSLTWPRLFSFFKLVALPLGCFLCQGASLSLVHASSWQGYPAVL